MTYLLKPTRLYIKQCSHCNLRYFGKTVQKNVKSYKGSGVYWKSHLKKHQSDSNTVWVSDWFYDENSITEAAIDFSIKNNIVESDDWANLEVENGLDGGNIGAVKTEDIKNKSILKAKETFNDPKWKKTMGKIKSDKIKKTMCDQEWNQTIGKERSLKIKQVKNSEEWKSGKGKIASDKIRVIMNDPEWKKTMGAERTKKANDTKNTPEWKEKHLKYCSYCKCGPFAPGVFSRFHDLNCKLRLT